MTADELNDRMNHIGEAREAIVAATGKVDCPICKTGKLRYVRAGVNGHIAACCSMPECASWRE